jgi:hypothetical protein
MASRRAVVQNVGLLTGGIIAFLAIPASAQTGALFSLGAEAVLHEPAGSLDRSLRLAPLIRLRLAPGLGPTAAIGGFRSALDDSGGGTMKVRTFMAGPAYRLERGRLAASAALLAGYASSRLDAAPSGHRARGSWALQPSVGLWYDVSESIGLRASLGYLVARPSLIVDSPSGPLTTRIRADALVMRLGVAYTVF